MKKIKFSIDIETNVISNEDFIKLQDPFYSRIIDADIEPMSFEELNAILQLDKRKFYTTSIQFPTIGLNDDSEIGVTNIEIKA